MRLSVALAQIGGRWEEPELTLRMAEEYVKQAVEIGAGLLCFPEQFATGWHPRSPSFVESLGGPITRELRRLAADYGIPLLGSFVEATQSRPRNTCVVFDSAGDLLASYAKIHLFSPSGEDRDYTPGESLASFSLEGVRFGIAICYDLRFPPLFALYAQKGVDCIIVPAAWPCRRIRHWELLLASRALESGCYTAGVNRTGITPVETYCGHSLIASPSGNILAQAAEEEILLCGEIDTDQVQQAREALPATDEYRFNLYAHLYREGE